jgi:hypothetical protein
LFLSGARKDISSRKKHVGELKKLNIWTQDELITFVVNCTLI